MRTSTSGVLCSLVMGVVVMGVSVTARAPALLAAVAAAVLLAACTTGADPGQPAQAAPPAPPAACLLDTASFAAATGLTWTPDETTASDSRCVYDPPRAGDGATGGIDFVAVDLAPATAVDVATELDRIAELCDDGSRAPVTSAGFVCRFRTGSVFAAAVRGGQVMTVAASAVPSGTTAARLVLAFTEQLTRRG